MSEALHILTGPQLCRLLGLEPSLVQKIEITAEGGGPVNVRVTQIVESAALEVVTSRYRLAADE